MSHLNYGTTKIKINIALDESLEIRLDQIVTELKDIVVTNVPVNEILYRAIEQSRNDLSSPSVLDTYYREFVKTNDRYTKFSDGLLIYRLEKKKNVKSTVWVKESRAVELYNESEEEMDWDLTSQLDVRKALDQADISSIGNFALEENADKYLFDLSVLRSDDLDDSLHIISVSPKADIEESLFAAKVVINPTSNHILEVEYYIPDSHIGFSKEANVLILKAKILGEKMRIVFSDTPSKYSPAYLLKEVSVRIWNKNIDEKFLFLSDVVVTNVSNDAKAPEEKLRYKKKSLYKREEPPKTQFWLSNNSLRLTKEQEEIIASMKN